MGKRKKFKAKTDIEYDKIVGEGWKRLYPKRRRPKDPYDRNW